MGDANTELSDDSTYGSFLRQIVRPGYELDPAAAPALVAGDLLGERFEVVREIGRGGFARVYQAHDRTLSRPVAIKLLARRRRLSRQELELFFREAQATARLNHPSIVTAHDWGQWNGTPFLVLELLEGQPLSALVARGPLTEKRAVAIACEIARALVYAHSQRVFHLDLKSQNVFLLESDRVKVLDFGMAGLDWDRGEVPGCIARIDGGTPATMAPEQDDAGPTDARTDVWAVGVILHEMLFGLPAKLNAERAAVPVPSGASRAVARILGKTLVRDPAARYSDATELVAALQRASRKPTAVGVLAAGGALAGALAVLGLTGSTDPCPSPDRELAAVWGAARRADLRTRLVALDPARGEARFAAAVRAIDPFATGWRDMHVEACRATRVRGAQSDTLLDLRMRCLTRRLGELDGAMGILTSARDAEQLDSALGALAELTPLARCGDAATVERDLALPPGVSRAAADKLAQRIQAVEIAYRANRLVGLTEIARQVVVDARALNHLPTLAAALAALANVQFGVDDSGAAETTLRELTQVAAQVHDDRQEASAWRSLVFALGDLGEHDQALSLVPAASAALLRAGNPVDLRAELLYAEAAVLDLGPRAAEALTKLDEARALLESAGAAHPGSPLAPRLQGVQFEKGNALHSSGDEEGAVASYRAAIETARAIYGPDSIDESLALHGIGEAYRRAGELDLALEALRAEARINQARTGQSARSATTMTSIAAVLSDQGHHDDALAMYEEAIATLRHVLAGDDLSIVPALTGRASELDIVNRVDEATRAYEELIALIESSKVTTLNLPIALYNRGEMRRRRGGCREALWDYQRSAEQFAAQRGDTTSFLLYPLVGEGRCHVVLRQPAGGIPPLERAATLAGEGADTLQVALAQAYLGRALVDAGRDRKRGLALAKRGRELLAEVAASDPDNAESLAELDRWLAAH